jgi:enamidase
MEGFTMRWSVLVVSTLTLAAACARPVEPPPADLLIRDARIVTGSGTVIPNGSIAIRGGRIETVAAGAGTATATRVVDAQGRTLLPGLIDVHRHVLSSAHAGSEEELQAWIDTKLPAILEGLLANGLTTLMSPGDSVPEIYELQARLERGDLRGPRLITAGRVFTAPGDHPAGGLICQGRPFCRERLAFELDDPEAARAAVRQAVAEGADFIKVVIDRAIVPNAVVSDAVLEAIGDESERAGVRMVVHALSVDDMMRAVDAGADGLVHSPMSGSVKQTGAVAILEQRGIPIATTVAHMTPAAAERTGRPFSEERFGQLLSNIRDMVDGGVVVAFGTDSPAFLGVTEFMYEADALGTVLSAPEVIDALTVQAARYLGIDDRLGTLEPGRIADLVMVDGDPIEDLGALRNVVLVVKDGRVVVEK